MNAIESNKLPRPAIGSIWKHKKGNLYTVLGVTSQPDDEKAEEFPVTVYYKGPDGKTWPRTLQRWHASMTPTGKTDQRVAAAVGQLLSAPSASDLVDAPHLEAPAA